jgi:hypothetical protein
MSDTPYFDDDSSWLIGLSCSGACLSIGLVYFGIYFGFAYSKFRRGLTALVETFHFLYRSLQVAYTFRSSVYSSCRRYVSTNRGKADLFFWFLWMCVYIDILDTTQVVVLITLYVYYFQDFLEKRLPKYLEKFHMLNNLIHSFYNLEATAQPNQDLPRPRPQDPLRPRPQDLPRSRPGSEDSEYQ